MYDTIVVGAGPGGLSAATTASMEGIKVLLLEGSILVGGQISHSALVENLLPHAHGFSGEHFRQNALEQCKRFGVDLRTGYHVGLLKGDDTRGFEINNRFYGRSVILSLGVTPKPLPFAVDMTTIAINNGPELSPVRAGDMVMVYGGGNSVGQAAIEYRSRGAYVTVLSRRPLEETMSSYLIAKLRNSNALLVVGEIDYIDGQWIYTKDNNEWAANHLHVMIGSVPHTNWLPPAIHLDDSGYIVTDSRHMTSVRGIFAVGDVVSNSVKRVSCAIGCANECIHYLHRHLKGEF